MSNLISLKNIWLRRGERELFGGLDLDIAAGELVWLRAPNGCGKTTLIRVIAGLIDPEQGSLAWKSDTFANRYESDRAPMSLLDEKLGLARDLDVAQNLDYAAALADQSADALELTCRQLNLSRLMTRPVSQLSTGQKKRVGLARLVLENAELWLLDEPANGLDAENRQLLCQQIEQHVHAGGACVFASHDELPFSARPREIDLELLCAA